MNIYTSDSIAAWPCVLASRHPDRPAVTDSRRTVTYSQLERRVAELSAALTEAGVSAGDRVAVLMKNRVEFVELLFCCARIGAIFTPLNYRLNATEIAFILDDSAPALFVAEPELEALAKAAHGLSSARSPRWSGLPDADSSNGMDTGRSVPAGNQYPPGAITDPVMMLYTSGTTASPKGVLLTHENLLWNAFNAIGDWGLRRSDTTLVVNPAFHSQFNVMGTPLLYLGGHVIMVEDFDPSAALDRLRNDEVTVMFAVSTAWQMIAALPDFNAASLGRLRLGASGGMAAPLTLLESFAELGVDFVQAYGLTETAPLATTVLVEETLDKVGSIGRGFMNVEVKVADETGRPVPPGERGEIWIRGRNVSPGYWRRPDETRTAFLPDRWFRTGDIATWDEDGCLYVVDRLKDMIISGGENISSLEVEQVLYRHPAVSEVAIVAARSERWGETPRAVVVLRAGSTTTASELIEHCRGLMARYKCPTIVDFVPDLPRTATGKLRKVELRATDVPERDIMG